MMRTMCENLTEDMNLDEYEAPPPLDPDDPTPPPSQGSPHWTRSGKSWELVRTQGIGVGFN
eukprot:6591513-Prorocentrum_lima.AAC.1